MLAQPSVSFHLLPLAKGATKPAPPNSQKERRRASQSSAAVSGVNDRSPKWAKGQGKGKPRLAKRANVASTWKQRSGGVQPRFHGQAIHQFFALDVFAGSSRLTAVLRMFGLNESFGVDNTIPRGMTGPVIYPLHVQQLESVIANPGCVSCHFAPPCGTASRARLIQRRGRYNPPILRTDERPNGLPSLAGVLAAKVRSANHLYQVTCHIGRVSQVCRNNFTSLQKKIKLAHLRSFLSDGESKYSSGLRSLRTPRRKKLRDLTPLGIQVDRSTRTSTERGRDFTRHPVGRIALAGHPFNPEAHPSFFL